MNKLSGGYVMLDLTYTKKMAERVKEAYESGKPVMIYADGVMNYVTLVKDSSTSYTAYLPNGTKYVISTMSGVATLYNTFPRYRHIITLSGTIEGSARTFTIVIENQVKDAYTTAANALSAIKNHGFDSATDNRVALVADSASHYSMIYASTVGTSYYLYSKSGSNTTFSQTISTNITVTDTVKTLY